MGMCLGLVKLGDENIRRVLEDPPLVWRVIAPDDPEAYQNARRESSKGSFLSRLFGKAKQVEAVPNLILSDKEGVSADLDKAWHGIHYLFTGTAEGGEYPLNFLVCGGRQIGDLEVGYGPARAFGATEVREIETALSAIGDEDLRSRFNPAEMVARDIYPKIIWTRSAEEDDPLGYLMENVRALRDFLKSAVNDGVGLIIYLS